MLAPVAGLQPFELALVHCEFCGVGLTFSFVAPLSERAHN